jgi:hypothetical protein
MTLLESVTLSGAFGLSILGVVLIVRAAAQALRDMWDDRKGGGR